jgi:hypothetical protein
MEHTISHEALSSLSIRVQISPRPYAKRLYHSHRHCYALDGGGMSDCFAIHVDTGGGIDPFDSRSKDEISPRAWDGYASV